MYKRSKTIEVRKIKKKLTTSKCLKLLSKVPISWNLQLQVPSSITYCTGIVLTAESFKKRAISTILELLIHGNIKDQKPNLGLRGWLVTRNLHSPHHYAYLRWWRRDFISPLGRFSSSQSPLSKDDLYLQVKEHCGKDHKLV